MSNHKEMNVKVIVANVWIDLSRTYRCILRDLLLAKLDAYGIDNVALLLISKSLVINKVRK